MAKKIIWTKEMIKSLYDDRALTLYDHAKKLGMSETALCSKMKELGISKGHMKRRLEWSDEMIKYLCEHFPQGTVSDIAYNLGISPGTVSAKARELGLKHVDGWSRGNFHGRYVNEYKGVSKVCA